MADMRALTVKPPWSHAIAWGTKRVENRGWPAPKWIIGQDVAIHAGKGFDWDAEFPPGATFQWAPPEDLALGAVVAVSRIAGCHLSPDFGGTCGATRPLCSLWAVRDQFHWRLADVRPLPEPVPCRGALGLWRLPEDVAAQVNAQLEATRA